MRSLVAISIVGSLLAFSSNVFAADLPPQPPVKAPAMVAPPAFSWTGIYIGAHAGGVWSTVKGTDLDGDGTADTVKINGWLAGGQIGANYQIGNIVLGVQGDYAYADVKKTVIVPAGVGFGPGAQASMKNDFYATATGRVGVAFDTLLIYGKGGVAFTRDKLNFVDGFGGSATGTWDRTGWDAGAGIEWAFAGNWSLFAEYNYMSFGKRTETPTVVSGLFPLTASSASVSLNTSIAKAGINFRF
jgi:outer membrane immunogenic protein